jgi:hypothetical protein
MGDQDPLHAQFSNCFLPYISAIPAAIGLCILLVHALRLLLPRRYWPEWTYAFIKEPQEQPDELEPKEKLQSGRLTAALLVVSSAGFALQALAVFYPSFRFQAALSALPWVCST